MAQARVPLNLRLSLALCGLLVSVPFLNPVHDYPFLSFYTEWLAFILGLAALAAIAMRRSGNSLPIPALCIGLIALTALLAVQVALGQVAYPLRSAMGALYTIWAGLLVILGAWLRTELGEEVVGRALQWWLAAAGLLVAASGFVQYYHTPLGGGVYAAVQSANHMFGTVNQRNNFADYLGCALVSLAFLHARNALGLFPSLVMALPVAAGMALSGSRGSWGYIVIALVLAVLVSRGGQPGEAGRILRVAAFALAAFLLIQILNSHTEFFTGPEGRPSSAGERLLLGSELGAGRAGRGQLFQYAWLIFSAHPILGAGFGEFAWRAFELAGNLPDPVPRGLDRHSHNLFLQLLAETGIAGLLCVAVPLVLLFWRTPWRDLRPERCWAIGVLAIVGLHSMLEFPLWHANFLGMFALLFGVALPGGVALEPTRLRRWLVLAIALAGAVTARGVWSDYRAFERWYEVVESKSERGETAGRSDLENLMQLREDSFFAPYFERIASEAIALDEQGVAEKLALNTQVMRIYPMPSVVLRQAALLAQSGNETEALRTLRGAIRVYPGWSAQWLPTLEALARNRPDRFSGLLKAARAQLIEVGR